MKRLALLFMAWLFSLSCPAQEVPKRPRILGISEVHMYATNAVATRSFYRKVLDARGPCHWCEEIPRSPMIVPLNEEQILMLRNLPTASTSAFLVQISFSTDDLTAMKRFLKAKGIAFSAAKGVSEITLSDPEGHQIAFTQYRRVAPNSPPVYSTLHLIHAGFVVRDRTAEDRFYKDILGFRVYWHGGMKDDETDWVDMQVPDGTDWIEYMLNVSPNADKKELGVMNHIAIGVADIKSATERLREDNAVPILEEPKPGRDGKWQLNLYDPDDTRVEFMEFTPTQKPCCSEYTGPHPGQKP
jgi:catechol 2,3-dioxygenase-like lactoylglutathione lyase family enzyme